MRRNRVLVVVADEEKDRLIRRITIDAMPGWEESVTVVNFPRRPKNLSETITELSERIENELSSHWQSEAFGLILLDKSLAADAKRLVQEGVRIRQSSHSTIYRAVLDELKKRRLHWETHSSYEWTGSGIRYLHPQAWKEQFAQFGYGWVAEGLLKQIRVVADAELRNALRVSDPDTLGLKIAHAYIKDPDPGSSSTNIKDLLEHTYTDKVFEVDLANDQSSQFSKYDVLYLYEDGLWSGVELVKRLKQVAIWTAVKERTLKIVFRFGVTSDAGLFAGRNFLRRERLTTIDIAAGIITHQRFLKPGSLDSIFTATCTDDETIRKALDQCACAFAFDDARIWTGRSDEAKGVCREIGIQLTKEWLRRTKGEEDLESKANSWSLGAFGFASMTAFAKSVPKPVLPLLWLAGDVTLNGRKAYWNPLFWDARRTGAPPPTPTN